MGSRKHLCLYGPQLYNYTNVPTLIAQARYDTTLMTSWYHVPETVDQDEMELKQYFQQAFQKQLLSSFQNIDGDLDGLFAPACSSVRFSSIRKLKFIDMLGLWCIGELSPQLRRAYDECNTLGCGGGCSNGTVVSEVPEHSTSNEMDANMFNPAAIDEIVKYVDRPGLVLPPFAGNIEKNVKTD
eukprot:c3904_g1_i2.p1 GENE.c3904_g1_i2~~c3904_g1_i2.p1  ORF type:complete len:184 (-),score=35.90 c3904_g1_i2:102-653(-)